MSNLRKQLFPGEALPQVAEIIDEGKQTAETTTVGQCVFLDHFEVSSEHEYKIEQTKSGRVMRHAQIGYRSLDRSCRAYREIHETLEEHDCGPDRYGICLDWSMGYFQSERSSRLKGTGLILDSPESFAMLTAQAVEGRANAIAISTYNGIALGYLEEVQSELIRAGLSEIPVYIGGKLNQIVDTGNDMPVDVTERLREAGAIPCRNLEEMLVDVVATIAANI